MKKMLAMLIVAGLLVLAVGCQNPQSCVVATGNTGIGVVVSYNPQTQLPDCKLGYVNSAFAMVPTNRAWDKQEIEKVGDGAKDTANVLFETNFSNWFKFWSDQSIYQRLAVGDEAVKQPGAVAMFAKNADGTANKEVVQALAGMIKQSKPVAENKATIAKAYTANKDAVIATLKELGYTSYDSFIDKVTDADKVEAVIAKLKEKGIIQ